MDGPASGVLPSLQLFAPSGVPPVSPGDNLAEIVLRAIAEGRAPPLCSGDVLVVAQKVVSKSEDRYVRLDSVAPSAQAFSLAAQCHKDPRYVQIVLQESVRVIRVAPGVLIVEDIRGLVLANAGVDRSNVDQADQGERLLLLPKDPDRSAASIRRALAELAKVDVAVVINDSIGRAWRLGTVGTAIGVSGLHALWDRRGDPDLQGRRLEITEVGLADELASAASVVMGQGNEGRPLVVIRGLTSSRGEGTAKALQRPAGKDLFR
jgi:coenzyme F420-0:L-glutamate ligase / coenzyme F420-1:gamma-L-glutamate ligase